MKTKIPELPYFVDAHHVRIIFKVSRRTAYKRMEEVRQKFDLPKVREVSLEAFCECYKISEAKARFLYEAHYKTWGLD